MARALNKGMLGSLAQAALAPSLAALGPNRYLRERDFFTMLGIAFVAHLIIIAIAGLWPQEKVVDIPVRALSFKIGGQDRIAAYGAMQGVGVTTAPAITAPAAPSTPGSWRATPVTTAPLKPRPIKKPTPKIVPIPVKPSIAAPSLRQVPLENSLTPLREEPALQPVQPPQPLISVKEPPVPETPAKTLPSTEILTQVASPAIAPTPQRFIREVGGAPTGNLGLGAADGMRGGSGTQNGMSEATAESIRQRYEQQISAWVAKHKIYPASAGGVKAKVVVRVRIDRAGVVRGYALEQSSGNAALDAAAADMVARANPLPAVPPDYPAGSLIEFVIPVYFAP